MGSTIRLAAIIASIVVLLGFAFFAVDEMVKGSQTQQNALDNDTMSAVAERMEIDPTPDQEAARERRNGAPRELIDDANDVLLAPFAVLLDSDSAWVSHGVPTVLALLLYGVGLGLLANMLPKERCTATIGAPPSLRLRSLCAGRQVALAWPAAQLPRPEVVGCSC
jgi:hypothetical protein